MSGSSFKRPLPSHRRTALQTPSTESPPPNEEELLTYQGQVQASNPEAFRGITVGPITFTIAEQLGLNSTNGVVIMEVESGSRAEEAGLSKGDAILEIDHVAISSVEAWDSAVSELDEDDEVTLTIHRDGSPRFIVVE